METLAFVYLVLAIIAFTMFGVYVREWVRESREEGARETERAQRVARQKQEDDDFEKEMADIDRRYERIIEKIRAKHERRSTELKEWSDRLRAQFEADMAALLPLLPAVDKTGKPV